MDFIGDKNLLIGIFLATAFLFYGSACLVDNRTKAEFYRFGIPRYRKLIGISQILGSLGLIIGLWQPVILFIAAIAFAIQMAMGFLLRISIRDSLFQTAPSLFFMLLSAYLAYSTYDKILNI